jgi:hypothetical protein
MGVHTNYVYAVDNADNSSAVKTVLVVRASIPTVAITIPVNGSSTTVSNFTVFGTASIDVPYSISKVEVQLNNGSWVDATGTNAWSNSVTLTLGSNSIIARAIGSNNKTNTTAPVIILYYSPTKFLADDGAANDNFGNRVGVSADGNTMVAGALWDDDMGADSGSAYIFRWTGTNWITNKIVASDGAGGDRFGYSVAVSGDGGTVVVGAPFDDDNNPESGSIYRYHWNGSSWAEDKFAVPAVEMLGSLGVSVAVTSDGNTIIAGAFGDNMGAGTAYRFHWNGTNWITNKFAALDSAASDNFGSSVAVSSDGDTIIIGAINGDQGAMTDIGTVYRFHWNGSGWITNKFNTYIGMGNDKYSCSVAVSSNGNAFVVGAYGHNVNSGVIYYYKWNNPDWETNQIFASDGATGDNFGFSLEISADGNKIAVGAYGDDDNGVDSGSIYSFTWNGGGWETNKITAADGAAGDAFGYSVAVSPDGSTIVTGAYFDDDMGADSGSVYRYLW